MRSSVVDCSPLWPASHSPASRLPRAAACLLALLPLGLAASGTRVGFKDAFATARGDAFVATADNASAIFYNPAGLTQLNGQELTASGYLIQLGADYTSSLTGRTSSLKKSTDFVPQVFYAFAPANARWAVGLGYYVPFGLRTDWNYSPDLFEFATTNKLTYSTISPVFAWRPADTISIGGGLNFNHLDVNLNRGVVLGVGQTALFGYHASGNDVGYHLGLRWQPSDQHAFGLSYEARTNAGTSGTSTLPPLIPSEPASAKFAFPEVIVAGYSYRPSPLWNLEADLEWMNWNCLQTVTINKPSGPVPLVFDWKSSSIYEFGATRYLNNGWRVSAGLTYTENSVPDATFNPALPDANRWFLNAGVGYNQGPLRVELAVQRATSSRTVHSGQMTLAGSTPDGKYTTSINTLSFSLGYRF